MATTFDALDARLRMAFEALASGADPVLRPSEHADFQANGIMALAKRLERPPREVAAEVVAALELDDLAQVEIAGPGFLNITLNDGFISERLLGLLDDDRIGVARATVAHTVVLDYSHPNVAKEMHVGHLRSTVIGDSLRRMYEFVGHEVIRRNHVGDWGTPFGMLIEHLLDLGEQQAAATLSIGDLDGFYKDARAKFDGDDEFADRSRKRVVALQGGDAETLRLWRTLFDESVGYFDEVYRKLDVGLVPSDAVGESSYNDQLEKLVEDLAASGLLVESDGALCVFPPGFTNREGQPLPLIVRKSDEGFGYAATDLAAIRDRVDHLRADEILYVVGAPQAQHLAMVFATARLAGWLPDSVRCEHVPFGNVLGPDRKMLRSRRGQSIKLVGLLDEAVEQAEVQLSARDPELGADDRRQLAWVIARAAIKYADLSTERTHDYVFDLERMVAFEGDTGPYLCYAHARIRSIFRRLGSSWEPVAASVTLDHPAERLLALGVLGFPEAVQDSLGQLAPHRLCTYLFDLAQRFTAFYESCPVLNAEPALRESRLVLCELSARALEVGLGLLGIEAPARM
jgi:arginyl-tRNA synthetase